MDTLTTKEFFEQLNSNTLKQPLILKGIVKKSEKDSEVLFTAKADSGWVAIPEAMIESVKVMKIHNMEGCSLAEVKLLLKTSTTPEGKMLAELLSSACQCNRNECNCNKAEHCGNAGGDNICTHCGCHRDEHLCGCGHKAEYRSNSCGFHEGHH